jgi:hypothetical protein
MNDELFYDYLDGLLEPQEAREAEAAIARDPARFAEIARRRAILYRPYAVAAASARLARLGLLRYAAVFLLGVLVPLLLPLAPKPHDPQPEPAPVEVTNRRLR